MQVAILYVQLTGQAPNKEKLEANGGFPGEFLGQMIISKRSSLCGWYMDTAVFYIPCVDATSM